MRKLVSPIAGALLNPKGRVLYDVVVGKQDQDVIIECNTDQVEDLSRMLNTYKLRKKVEIQNLVDQRVFAVWGKTPGEELKEVRMSTKDELWMKDPRPGHALGHRVWANTTKPTLGKFVREVEEDVYHQVRMAHGLVEGKMECFEELPFTLNLDWWPSSLAWDKGCYTGQELVARTHFKGQVRKRIVPVLLSLKHDVKAVDPLLPGFCAWPIHHPYHGNHPLPVAGAKIEPIDANDANKGGEGTLVRLAPGGLNLGLAVLRDPEHIPAPDNSFIPTHRIDMGHDRFVLVQPIRPDWWPQIAIDELIKPKQGGDDA